MKKVEVWITIFIVLAVGIVAYFILNRPQQTIVSVSLSQCIGNNSLLYVQAGCSHCADQEALFGNNFKYLNSTDCLYNPDVCIQKNITATPTWIIKGKYYLGTQSIATLQNLTGC